MTTTQEELLQDLMESAKAMLEGAAKYEPDLTWQDLAKGAQKKAQEALRWQASATTARNATSNAAQRAMAQQELKSAAVQMIAAYLKVAENKR